MASTPDEDYEVLRNFLKGLFEEIPETLVVKDEFGRYVKVNPHFRKLLGRPASDILGKTDHDLFPSATADLIVERDRAVLTSGQAGSAEDVFPARDRLRTFLTHRIPVAGASGRPAYVCALQTDVSKFKQREEDLVRAKEEAERAKRAESRFLAAASHDLRQPIQAASLYLKLLQDRIADPDCQALLGMLKTSIDGLHGMLGALLDLSRLEAGVIEPVITDVPLADILAHMVNEYQPQAEAAGLAFRAVGCSERVCTDPTLLMLVLRNLLSNAIKHTTSGEVLFGCRRRRDAIEIQIWDTGPGIPEASLLEIFEEFRQLDTGTEGRGRGFGLGLAIVARTANLLGCSVRVRSTVGLGSMFSIRVPRAVSQAELFLSEEDCNRGPALEGATDPRATGKTEGDSEAGEPYAGEWAVIVEDDPHILSGLTLLLESWGLRVVQARTAEDLPEALSALDRSPILVIADYRLPGGRTARDVVALVESHYATPLPSIVLTGDTALKLGAGDVPSHYRLLHKPIDPARLHGTLREVLKAHRPDAPLTPSRT